MLITAMVLQPGTQKKKHRKAGAGYFGKEKPSSKISTSGKRQLPNQRYNEIISRVG
jgi:hypothetical protein